MAFAPSKERVLYRHMSNPRTLAASLFLSLAILSCQRAPTIAPSADSASAIAMAPMESGTSNVELHKRKALLDRLLDGQIAKAEFDAALQLKGAPSANEETKRLSELLALLELTTMPQKRAKSDPERQFQEGQYYFFERRFIEAAQIFSVVLDKKPSWARPRNLLARCFYFLGNTDRAFLELQYVLTQKDQEPEEVLDALFLMGAMAIDAPNATDDQLQKGLGAWRTYLKLAPHSPLKEKIQDGLLRFEQKHKHEAPSAAKGNLKQEALAALEGEDRLLAETKIREALKGAPKDEELQVALARLFVKSGRVQEALSEFRTILKKNPQSTKAYHYQGMAFMMAGDPKSAIASWEKVMQLDKAYGERFNLQGRIGIAQNLLKKDSP